uniref:Uncharacterized protein n=1 Tax=Arundo donax TaxID=35708 RepID=A0A0A9DE39_ARUDO
MYLGLNCYGSLVYIRVVFLGIFPVYSGSVGCFCMPIYLLHRCQVERTC